MKIGERDSEGEEHRPLLALQNTRGKRRVIRIQLYESMIVLSCRDFREVRHHSYFDARILNQPWGQEK